ncbi:MAG TPA: CDP-alcohol phosphatidyltransferase family protein [Polyangia bacterium]|jgi:phosphatidylglycerophosphate synthase|nr:CDP-alcohol phosphatidyltransferase family protein [Polyangia bacterium]
MLATVRSIYRQSKKPQDNFWNNWVSRPPAAVVVWLLRPTPITPNQVTFMSLAVFALAAGVLIGWRTHLGLVVGALVVQTSYVLDCVDGQLARYKGLASPVGALLDFLMDEIKAFLLIAAATVRLWLVSGQVVWLLVGLGGLVAAATGITLTSFMRRPEYLAATAPASPLAVTGGGPMPPGPGNARRSPIALAIAGIEQVGKFVVHYPSWFLYIAIANRLEWFVYIYLGAHILYLGRSGLSVLVRLGRPQPRS